MDPSKRISFIITLQISSVITLQPVYSYIAAHAYARAFYEKKS